jgi:dipeptidase E
MRRLIFAIGGAGFAMRHENDALHDYALSLSGASRPRICLLPTASGDPGDQIAAFHQAFGARGCEATHVSLFRLGDRPAPLREQLYSQDLIYVGGGSMLNLLALWKAHGIDDILRGAWRRGVILCGFSAGAMCWFEAGITRSTGEPSPHPGLALLPGSNCVHYDSDPARREAYLDRIADGMPAGLALGDHVGALFEGRELREVVSGRARPAAHRVELEADAAVERRLDVRPISPERDSRRNGVAELRTLRTLERRGRGMASVRLARGD